MDEKKCHGMIILKRYILYISAEKSACKFTTSWMYFS